MPIRWPVRTNRLAAIVVVLSLLVTNLAFAAGAINVVPTHPNFWALTTSSGTHNYTGKKYERVLTRGSYTWAWSGPLGGAQRAIHYCNADPSNSNNCVATDLEWERWADLGDGNSAKALQFGGTTSATSLWRYPSATDCSAGT